MSGRRKASSTPSSLLSTSAMMAAGTLVSRVTGFLRAVLIFAAIGKSLNAEVFTLSNTIPNALYILVAGGIFNVVLVPQLVRAMRNDPDGGDAYANRIITLGLLVLAAATVVLVVAVPVLVRLVFDADLFDPQNSGARESAYALMRYCMPQVFFYGAFVLVGQVLNARERFGPMMWAPIVNNVVSCGVLFAYIGLYGSSNEAGGFSVPEELLLGWGSTLGIALQAAVLVPYLRAAGFRFRPRLDFRGVGLGHTLRLGLWTLFFIIANQIAFFVVNRVASGSATTAKETGGEAAGATVYQFAFLVSQVPHGIITVSIVTATMPMLSRLAADGLREDVRGELNRSMRLVLSAIVPIAVAVACLGQALATVTASYGGTSGDTRLIGLTIMSFAPGMVLFSVHYLMLRGFYAMENTRTPFLVQIWLSGTNIALAIVLTSLVGSALVSTVLALSYGGAYLVGSVISTTLLSRRVGRILDARTLSYLFRLAVACVFAAAAMVGTIGAFEAAGMGVHHVRNALLVLAVGGPLGAGVYLLAARLLRISEVTALVGVVLRRR
ncbi:MAG: murein biosynthesis integral membrane protein MurJ [Nocardioidaceae bacterium]